MSDRPPTGQPDASDDQQAAQAAWDRVGRYMEGLGAVGERLVQRNFTFWKDVASSLQSGPMDADKLAATTARAMVATQETVEDIWMSLVEPPQSEVYVQVLPTAFLFFDQIGGQPTHPAGSRAHPGQPAAEGRSTGAPPRSPSTAVPPIASVDAADAVRVLTDRLRTSLIPGARAYLLETVAQGEVAPLVPGTYDGLVYLIKPSLPLANLRIIVDGPPPEV